MMMSIIATRTMASYPILTSKYQAIAMILLCTLVILPLTALSQDAELGQESIVYLPLVSLSRLSPLPYPNCRYGSIPLQNPVNEYDIAPLNLGWYLTHPISTPPRPNDILPMHIVRLKGRACSSPDCPNPEYWSEAEISPALGDDLGQIVDSNPGSIWLIGNEPDRVYYMDDVLPTQYAQAYHDAYAFIKARDPAAQIGIGGIVVPTPLRLEYLDKILHEYKNRYGHPMPVDVWNTHVHIVQEVRDSWGADVPPGSDADVGILFTKSQHADVQTFKELIIDFRSWMAAHGRQDKPLIITEFGVLWPDWLVDEFGMPFDAPRVIDFMHETMAWLDSEADPALGYPADNYRLVQRWNWFSLDDDSIPEDNPPDHHQWNGWLFESETRNRSVFGDAFAAFTNQIWPTNDLLAYRFRTSPPPPLVSPGETATVTLQIDISNTGNVPVDQPFTVAFYEQISDTLDLIATTTVMDPVAGCGGVVTAQGEWSNVSSGSHQILISVDPANAIAETSNANNELVGVVLIPTRRLYLPITSLQ